MTSMSGECITLTYNHRSKLIQLEMLYNSTHTTYLVGYFTLLLNVLYNAL